MMSGRGDGPVLAAGGPARHIPVLRDEAVAALHLQAGGTYLDGTFGAGGYTSAILATPGTRVIALDRDPRAIADGAGMVESYGDRLVLEEARFGDLDDVVRGLGRTLDGVVLDIGVSSMQLDEEKRGFSFRVDGPLDMRMGKSGESAADIVNMADEQTLADIFYYYGEERASRRIARAIVHDRAIMPFTRTKPLAEMIARVVPQHGPRDIHPATRSFQALRIAVNDELGELLRGLVAAERVIRPGGRLAVVTFHSLEDRIVKRFFAARSGRGVSETRSRHMPSEPDVALPSFMLETRQPVGPSTAEVESNPRSRSAKLRAGIRTAAPPLSVDPKLLDLARLPAAQNRR